jgi:hypothetical protein
MKFIKCKLIVFGIIVFFNLPLKAQSLDRNQKMSALISQNFAFADSQYSFLMKQVLPDKMPQSFDAINNQLLSREITWWCSGFYPGSLLYIYEQTKDEKIKTEALRALKVIESNQTYTGNHDLGFMMFCSFGNAYRLFKDETYKQIIFRSAASLSTRYRPTMKAIQSWNKINTLIVQSLLTI